jgi:hypothetical protein
MTARKEHPTQHELTAAPAPEHCEVAGCRAPASCTSFDGRLLCKTHYDGTNQPGGFIPAPAKHAAPQGEILPPGRPISVYRQIIAEAVPGLTDNDYHVIEEIMRHDIFHSTLDWQTKAELQKAATLARTVQIALKEGIANVQKKRR